MQNWTREAAMWGAPLSYHEALQPFGHADVEEHGK